jgi:aspartyl-tRNA(Asn)/glutamyl-tRNA(Gln) amidotransferase subunit A
VNAIYEKRTTVLEEVKYSLYQIKEKDKQIFGFVKVDGDAAIKCAIDLDNRLDNINSTYMPLLGVPIAIKDNICVSNMQTTASSFILEGYVPKHEATAVRLLKQAGAIVVGKTNTDEFGMGDSTMNSAYQVCFTSLTNSLC